MNESTAEKDAPTFVVHGLEPMTTKQLAALSCGHCRHRLTAHVTRDGGHTFCAYCHCIRHRGEDILRSHRVAEPTSVTPSAWCLCGVVDDRGDGTCGNCGLRIMTDDDGTRPIPPGVAE